ncbi:hypothetical protein AYI68_g7674, partial [Smittium mucronatum]
MGKTIGDHYKCLIKRLVNLGSHEGGFGKKHQTDFKVAEEARILESTGEVVIVAHTNKYTPDYENKPAVHEFRDCKEQFQGSHKRSWSLDSQGRIIHSQPGLFYREDPGDFSSPTSRETYDQKAYR